jgi:uncharacterized protein GlcG (DUF336 family)
MIFGSEPVTVLTLAQASTLIDAALAKGRAEKFAPLTVVVLDPGGHIIALKREDHSGIIRVEIATGKAYGSLGVGLGSRALFERAKIAPSFIAAATAASDGRLVPVPGGVLILDGHGHIAGAVGISGDTSDNDETCALAGIAAIAMKAKVD